MAPVVTMKQLLEAGVHFGHQTRRWNPKMKRFIYGERNGIYIIDLEQTLAGIETAYTFVRDLVADGGTVLFVGTKKQAQDPIQSYAEKCGMPYINERWLGGMLTNFETISKRVAKMKEYQRMRDSGEFEAMPKKEALLISRELEQARAQPGRHPQHGAPARRRVHPRHQEGAHRGDRGQQARHPDRGRGRHQLRPRHHPVRHPRQRRRHPLRQPHVPRHRRRRRGGPLHRAPRRGPAPRPQPPRPSAPPRRRPSHRRPAGRGPSPGCRWPPPSARRARRRAGRAPMQSAARPRPSPPAEAAAPEAAAAEAAQPRRCSPRSPHPAEAPQPTASRDPRGDLHRCPSSPPRTSRRCAMPPAPG